jgi:hypothetical protein
MPLLWQNQHIQKLFFNAGIYINHSNNRLLIIGLKLGGVIKLWNTKSNELIYQDCGYLIKKAKASYVSQADSSWTTQHINNEIHFEISSNFVSVPAIRFNPLSFICFRISTLAIGLLPGMSKVIKKLLVKVLILKKAKVPSQLKRKIIISNENINIIDELLNVDTAPLAIERQVPFHMGSARYVDKMDFLGSNRLCENPQFDVQSKVAKRNVII